MPDASEHTRLRRKLRAERRKVSQLEEMVLQLHRRLQGKGSAKPRQLTKGPSVGTTPKPPTSS